MRNKTLALGLGSNLADPAENLRRALTEIRKSDLFKVQKVSSIFESDALLPENANMAWNKKFLNAVVICSVESDCSAESILQKIKYIEKKMGRLPGERWAPRLIDIDILFWSDKNYSSENLNIPHRSLFDRPFALLPLLEVWSDLKLPLPPWVDAAPAGTPFNTRKSSRHFWPRLVGILNITEDSFSDGGRYLNADNLQKRIIQLREDGADIIDIGAESTRPGAQPVSKEKELQNLQWALAEIKSDISVSLDCRRPAVVAEVLEKFKISYLNDVTGFTNPAMKNLLLKSRLPGFVMHSLGVPPQAAAVLDQKMDPCMQLSVWWHRHSAELLEFGIYDEQLVFDPGIGFGKTRSQNLNILQHLAEFDSIKHDIMIGHSRKSFLTLLTDEPAPNRDAATAQVTSELNLAFVQYLRVHDVKSQVKALS